MSVLLSAFVQTIPNIGKDTGGRGLGSIKPARQRREQHGSRTSDGDKLMSSKKKGYIARHSFSIPASARTPSRIFSGGGTLVKSCGAAQASEQCIRLQISWLSDEDETAQGLTPTSKTKSKNESGGAGWGYAQFLDTLLAGLHLLLALLKVVLHRRALALYAYRRLRLSHTSSSVHTLALALALVVRGTHIRAPPPPLPRPPSAPRWHVGRGRDGLLLDAACVVGKSNEMNEAIPDLWSGCAASLLIDDDSRCGTYGGPPRSPRRRRPPGCAACARLMIARGDVVDTRVGALWPAEGMEGWWSDQSGDGVIRLAHIGRDFESPTQNNGPATTSEFGKTVNNVPLRTENIQFYMADVSALGPEPCCTPAAYLIDEEA
ncbi:hypothetical protein DFH09DRAFT_1088559 [Mycena vulgaris]|nr:hypothetical protein DFH09DRAFT_1088559 [Mycena vulgaris]